MKMNKITKYTIILFLSATSFNVFSEPKKCTLLTDGDISTVNKKVASTCKTGDILYYATGGIYNDLGLSLMASTCDFSKSIVLGNGEFVCVYNGVKKSR